MKECPFCKKSNPDDTDVCTCGFYFKKEKYQQIKQIENDLISKRKFAVTKSKKKRFVLDISVIVVLGILEIYCWGVTTSPWFSVYKDGPIDAQSGHFFLCLLALYPLVFISVIYSCYFVYKFHKSMKAIIIAILLNLHLIGVLIYLTTKQNS